MPARTSYRFRNMKLVTAVLFMASCALASPSYEPRQLFDDDEDWEDPVIESLEEA